MSDEERFCGECVRLDLYIGSGHFVHETGLANVGEAGDQECPKINRDINYVYIKDQRTNYRDTVKIEYSTSYWGQWKANGSNVDGLPPDRLSSDFGVSSR